MDNTSNPSGTSTETSSREDEPTRDDHTARVDAVVARLQDERLEVLPFYHDLRNQIVHPLNLHVETRYFFRKWKPMLGPVLTLLIMELRDRCYYNPRTGERRDYCWPSQDELARAIGVSVRTVIRALQDPLARKFIRVQHRYRYDPVLGKKVRTSSAYVVAMDDPLRPEDEAVLTRMVAEQILADEIAERNRVLTTSAPDLDVTLADSSAESPESVLTDKLADNTDRPLTDKLSDINMSDNLSEEEVLTGRHTQDEKDHNKQPRSHTSKTAPEGRGAPRRGGEAPPKGSAARRNSPTVRDAAAFADSLGRPAPSQGDLPDEVVQAYAAANDRTPTLLERQRLADLVRRFDPVARQADPPSTGDAWIVAAIVEAVDSGSAFVAPRRIATICERWAKADTRKRASPRRPLPSPLSISEKWRGEGGEARPHVDARSDLSPADQPPDPTDPDEPIPVDPFEEPAEVVIPTFVVSANRPVTNWQLWRLVTDELLHQSAGDQHRTWLEQAALIGEEDGALVIGAPSRFARDLLERRLGEPVAQAIAAILGARYPLRFVVARAWLAENQT
jgi:hypothetical protein